MRLYLFFIISLLFITSVSAELIILEAADENYLPGETIQLEVFTQNPVSELITSNLKVKDKNNNEIKVAPLISKIKENHYYIYFDSRSDMPEGNYTVSLEKIKFQINNILTEVTEKTTFNIVQGEPVITIKPAFFKTQTQKASAELQLINKGQTTQVTFTTSGFVSHPYETAETLKQGSRKFYFQIDPSKIEYNTIGEINVTYNNHSYTLPIYVNTGKEVPKPIEAPKPKAFEFLTGSAEIRRTLEIDEEVSGSLGIKNTLNTTVSNLKFILTNDLSEIITLNLTEKQSLNPEEIIYEYFTINKNKSPKKESYQGEFIVSSAEYSNSFPISINFEKKLIKGQIGEPIEVPIEQEESKVESEGLLGEELFKLPPAIVKEEKSNSKAGLYAVIIVILIFAAVIFKLTRKEKQKKTFKEYLGGINR